jgi:hypothetical protein
LTGEPLLGEEEEELEDEEEELEDERVGFVKGREEEEFRGHLKK